jgi:hypothetical protein
MLDFSLGQTARELKVIEAIKEFILNLPGSYKATRSDSNEVRLKVEKKAKNETSQPMVAIQVNKFDFLKNVLVPFFDSLV